LVGEELGMLLLNTASKKNLYTFLKPPQWGGFFVSGF
jgi:hypothetical protein